MIAIEDFHAFVAQLKTLTEKKAHEAYPTVFAVGEPAISHIVTGMQESHLVNLLKDKTGVCLCGIVPDFTLDGRGFVDSRSDWVLFLVEKTPKDHQGRAAEFVDYGRMQKIMCSMLEVLDGEGMTQLMCDMAMKMEWPVTVEWEYNIFGGFNGMSVGFKVKDDKGISI